MPVDTSIYNNIQPAKIDSPLNMLAQVSQVQGAQSRNKLADLAIQQHQIALDQTNALNNAYKGALKPDGSLDQNALFSNIANSGYGSQLPAVQKGLLDVQASKATIGKTTADTAKTQQETAQHQFEIAGQLAGAWAMDPTVNKQKIASGITAAAHSGVISQQMADAKLQELQSVGDDPASLQGWAKGTLGQVMKAKESMGFIAPDANTVATNATSRANNAATNATSRANNAATVGAMLDANNINKEAARTQVVETPEGLALVDKGTGQVRPAMGAGGEQVQQKDSPKYQAQKLQSQLEAGIKMARDLIPKATASGAGALVDYTAGFFGKSTPGADAASQLDTLAGWMTTNVPRMQGPQSDKDTLLYRQMAAQVGDRTKPASQRLAALNTLEALQKKYASIAGNAAPTKAGTKPSLDDIFK